MYFSYDSNKNGKDFANFGMRNAYYIKRGIKHAYFIKIKCKKPLMFRNIFISLHYKIN